MKNLKINFNEEHFEIVELNVIHLNQLIKKFNTKQLDLNTKQHLVITLIAVSEIIYYFYCIDSQKRLLELEKYQYITFELIDIFDCYSDHVKEHNVGIQKELLYWFILCVFNLNYLKRLNNSIEQTNHEVSFILHAFNFRHLILFRIFLKET